MAVEDGHELCARQRAVRLERRGAHAVHHARFQHIVDRLMIPLRDIEVGEGLGRTDLILRLRCIAGRLAVLPRIECIERDHGADGGVGVRVDRAHLHGVGHGSVRPACEDIVVRIGQRLALRGVSAISSPT